MWEQLKNLFVTSGSYAGKPGDPALAFSGVRGGISAVSGSAALEASPLGPGLFSSGRKYGTRRYLSYLIVLSIKRSFFMIRHRNKWYHYLH